MRKAIFISVIVVFVGFLAMRIWAGPVITYIGQTLSDGILVITGGNLTTPGSLTAASLSANAIKTPVSTDATLSGTPIIITIYDSATNTPYYFKAYPTKP